MTVEKKDPFSFKWYGKVLKMSQDEQVVRSYDFAQVPQELDGRFLEFGKQTKLGNFKASAKKLNRDPVEMMDEGFELLKSGEWAFEREGVVRAPEYLIVLVMELLDDSENGKPCTRSDAEVSLRTQKDTWPGIESAHAKRIAEIKKELAKGKNEAKPRDLGTLLKA